MSRNAVMYDVEPHIAEIYDQVETETDDVALIRRLIGDQGGGHGYAFGDVNGDGREDFLVTGGWWEAPEARTQGPWKFHKAKLGPGFAAHFHQELVPTVIQYFGQRQIKALPAPCVPRPGHQAW